MALMTVITPTYNRLHTLPMVYESLKKQTSNDFLWLIVDDGSTDDTEKWITDIAENDKSKFRIEYIKKKNGGKASALNEAFARIKTRYFCCLDSDDTFSAHAVEKALYLLESEADNDKCCGVLALRNEPNGKVMGGKRIDVLYTYATVPQLYFEADLHDTEVICFYKADAVRHIRFPEYSGERFVSPTWYQFKATELKSFRISGEIFCYCAYMEDGLTRNKRRIILKNPRGYTAVKYESFKYSRTLKQIVKNGIMYDYGCILGEGIHGIKNAPRKIWAWILLPGAYIIYISRKHK